MITVWKREGGFSDGKASYKPVVKVKVNGVGVFVEAYTIGPRGGFSHGFPGFTMQEWAAINAAIERGKCADHPDAEQATLADDGTCCRGCEPCRWEVSR